MQDKQSVYGHAIEEPIAGRLMSIVATLNGLFFALFNWYLDANHIDILLSILSNSALM